MKELVSILIPAYNAEKWIGGTIRSALNQTWSRKEIIIVNDGSSDNTFAIAKQFESGSLKVISQKNRGASAARNRALEHAQGDYIQWLDADDIMDSNKISEQMKNAEGGRTSLVLLSSSFGTFYWRYEKARFVPNALWQDLSPVDWLLNKFHYNLWLIPAAWLVSRRLTEKAGPWDERLSLDDDGEYFCRLVASSAGVRFIRQAKSYYRVSGISQLSMTENATSHNSLFLSRTLCITYLRSLEDSERTRQASLILLQRMHSYYFFAGRDVLLEKINILAHKLGKNLTQTKVGWKWNILHRLLGRDATSKIMSVAKKNLFLTKIRLDKLLYDLAGRGEKLNKTLSAIVNKQPLKNSQKNRKIWIDLDNSPHVPFFIPIMTELEKRGHSVFLTTRDCFQVCGLADYYKLNHKRIGKHYGANKLLKVLGTVWRSLQLASIVIKEKPDMSLSHGSRSLIVLSSFLRIPTILLYDYEHSQSIPFLKPALGIAPEVINDPEIAKHFKWGTRGYSGLKEDVYVQSFSPDSLFMQKLKLSRNDIVVTIRPPATEAHYHNPESEELFFEVVEFLGNTPDVRMVILPRNEKTQRELVYRKWPAWCKEGKIIVPDQALNGLDLIWHSDLVVSGGGTMNREAAALGVPVYSIFRGKIGAVDRYLAEQGRLILIKDTEEVRSKIRPIRRPKETEADVSNRTALKQILAAVEEVIEKL